MLDNAYVIDKVRAMLPSASDDELWDALKIYAVFALFWLTVGFFLA